MLLYYNNTDYCIEVKTVNITFENKTMKTKYNRPWSGHIQFLVVKYKYIIHSRYSYSS